MVKLNAFFINSTFHHTFYFFIYSVVKGAPKYISLIRIRPGKPNKPKL